jgi:3-isopropylmalate/(R)-2-methylmalate dehydratase large subunit
MKAKDIVMVKPDCVMIHDLFMPFVVSKFKEMGFKKVWNPEKIVIVYDHLVPTSSIEDVRHFKISEEFASEQGITKIHKSDGVCHQLMHELKYVLPGQIVFGTDSHTVTYGAIGAFATGIGYTDMAAILGTGETWIKIPETIEIKVDGKLPAGVFAKDIILKIIGDLKADGATYSALEFNGSAIDDMSISSRLTISNMVIEAGAKAGMFYPDEKTANYCNIPLKNMNNLMKDEISDYKRTICYDASKFLPVVALPSNVDNVKAISDIGRIEIDQVFIGSCTNGRLEDLEIAAKILNGKKISEFLKLIVTPASRSIYENALKNGIIKILLESGAIITHPGCGLCCGRSGGIICDGEKVLATNNRNFLGRMGSAKSKIYLASPAVAATSAITGVITAPEEYL